MQNILTNGALATGNVKIGALILKRFLVFLLLIAVALSAVSLPVYLHYKKGLREQLLAQEEISVVSAIQMFQKEMYEQLHLLDYIIKSNALKEYLNEGTPDQQLRVENIIENISTSFHRFEQIQLLDNFGQEKIRVNLVGDEALLVPEEELRNKAQRYYFKAAQKMPPGQIYISALELNVEQKVLEMPDKLTVRFATTLKDAQGDAAGVLVVNYLATDMLVRFRELMTQRLNQQSMLIDGQGHFLSTHERYNESGADSGGLSHSFAQFYPAAWTIIAANESGVLENKEGIFRYQSVGLLNFLDSKPAHFHLDHEPLISEESYSNMDLKLVIFLPKEVINSYSFLHQPLGRTLLGVLVLLIASLAWLGAYLAVQNKLRRQEEKHLRANLEQQASIDALTGVNNRRSFYELGEVELKRALRHKAPLAVLMLDADHFKKVNDNYGHAVGDMVLQDLAKTLVEILRGIDLLGRIGGEEFAVLLPNTPLPQALEVAERLRLKLEERRVRLPDCGTIRFTVSIGVVMLTSEDPKLATLLQKADIALYRAKKMGRNRVVNYTPEMSY